MAVDSSGPVTAGTRQRVKRSILWLVDRTGFNGRLYGIWRKAMQAADMNDCIVHVVNLEKSMHMQLLQSYMTRKAPTWKPELALDIIMEIERLTELHRPHAVVLSSPESLAITAVPVESATLGKLRGSIYWRGEGTIVSPEIPHLVMLPMTAWVTLVSEKEIRGAELQVRNQIDDLDLTDEADGDPISVNLMSDDDIDEDDGFFRYEPVLSPVGRFSITADLGKLNRVLRYGRKSPGLIRPFHLHWR